MTGVGIEYCVPCGLLAPAMKTEQALLEEFGQDLTRIVLRPGHGRVFEIRADGETIRHKEVHGGELDLNLITDAIRERALTA